MAKEVNNGKKHVVKKNLNHRVPHMIQTELQASKRWYTGNYEHHVI